MPPIRPQLSITLPRNFTFHYTDGQGPKTPEREQTEPQQPSPPVYRLRRRPRQNITHLGAESSSFSHLRSQDVPIPTIETPEPVQNARPLLQQRASEPIESLLAPASNYLQMASPKTPTAQLTSLFGHGVNTPGWRDKAEPQRSESTNRPVSSCSDMSDSSESSSGTWGSFPSLGGSCTTPDSEAPEPFSSTYSVQGMENLTSTFSIGGQYPEGQNVQKKTSSKHKKVVWTERMDNHLWATYLIYLQDPTVTPFKMLPGSAPPIGVCYRVAREAKQTWRSKKHSLDTIFETGKLANDAEMRTPSISSGKTQADGQTESPDTIKARSGSNTPTFPTPKHYQWPNSGSATRRRLIELCKSKPSIAPHYQRLMRNMSPVESHTSSARSRSSRFSTPFDRRNSAARFSTRDIDISLTTSTSASMQPNGALAQLARGSSSSSEQQHDEGWFNTPVQPTSTLSSSTSDAQEGLGIDGLDTGPALPRLGSPFGYHTWGPSRSRAYLRPSPPRTQSDSSSIQGPTLRSPLQLEQPLPFPAVLKRRAQHLLEDELSPGGTDVGRTAIEDMFGAPAESSHRRVRSRGFSLGDVTDAGRLSSMFTPPTLYDQMNSSEFAETATFGSNPVPLAAPPLINRLGSPFSFHEPNSNVTAGSSRHGHSSSNTFPRSSHRFSFASSIDQRLNELDQDEASRKRTKE
ncbi:hypothetical protein MMC16_002484 [Acarospora aff. strigata]|nr:hypothetical protein [Acarospora aff. strigata]